MPTPLQPPRPGTDTREPWQGWWHCTGSTYGAWLRGDARGWRARHHREHVLGDYKRPPPQGLYAPLARWSRYLMIRDAVKLASDQQVAACRRMVETLRFHAVEVLAVAVSSTHFHMLVRFVPTDCDPLTGLPYAKEENSEGSPGIAIPGRGERGDPPYRFAPAYWGTIPWKQEKGYAGVALATPLREPRHLVGIAKKESARTLSALGHVAPGGVWAVRSKCVPVRSWAHQVRVVNYIHAHAKHGAAVWLWHQPLK